MLHRCGSGGGDEDDDGYGANEVLASNSEQLGRFVHSLASWITGNLSVGIAKSLQETEYIFL